MTFLSDLSFGKRYEDIAISLLNEPIVHRPDGYFKEYDFKTDKSSYEVKADRLTNRTGNFFIEFQCSNKPSGIMSTTAEYWFYFVVVGDSYRAYKIPTSYLKSILKNNYRIMNGGDRNKGYLIPESTFKEFIFQSEKK